MAYNASRNIIHHLEYQMTLNNDVVRQLLEKAGLKPTDDQVNSTTSVYNVLHEQLKKVNDSELRFIEPEYIRPARRDIKE